MNKTTLNIAKTINIMALCCLIGGPYGIAFTGFLQVIAAIVFIFTVPKNKLIVLYFFLVLLYFLIWRGDIFGWQVTIPLGLIGLLTYIIHFQSKKNSVKPKAL